MSYLLDRKSKRRNFIYIVSAIVLLVILFFFRSGVLYGLSYVSSTIFRPIFIAGNNVGDKFQNTGSFFTSKSSLLTENEELKRQLGEAEARMSNYNSVVDENAQLKEILGRKNEKTAMILSAILSKPNQSPYDTLVIDVGENKNVVAGSLVFAEGNVPIGRVAEAYAATAKVILFTNSGEKTEVVISGKNIFSQIVGRGGGNFEMILPRDFIPEVGTEVVLPGITPYVVGIVETIISDPRDAFTKALLTNPVNIFELKFVEIEL